MSLFQKELFRLLNVPPRLKPPPPVCAVPPVGKNGGVATLLLPPPDQEGDTPLPEPWPKPERITPGSPDGAPPPNNDGIVAGIEIAGADIPEIPDMPPVTWGAATPMLAARIAVRPAMAALFCRVRSEERRV